MRDEATYTWRRSKLCRCQQLLCGQDCPGVPDTIRLWSRGEVKKRRRHYGPSSRSATGCSASGLRPTKTGVSLRQVQADPVQGISATAAARGDPREVRRSGWATSSCRPVCHIWYLKGVRAGSAHARHVPGALERVVLFRILRHHRRDNIRAWRRSRCSPRRSTGKLGRSTATRSRRGSGGGDQGAAQRVLRRAIGKKLRVELKTASGQKRMKTSSGSSRRGVSQERQQAGLDDPRRDPGHPPGSRRWCSSTAGGSRPATSMTCTA